MKRRIIIEQLDCENCQRALYNYLISVCGMNLRSGKQVDGVFEEIWSKKPQVIKKMEIIKVPKDVYEKLVKENIELKQHITKSNSKDSKVKDKEIVGQSGKGKNGM